MPTIFITKGGPPDVSSAILTAALSDDRTHNLAAQLDPSNDVRNHAGVGNRRLRAGGLMRDRRRVVGLACHPREATKVLL